MLAVWTTGGRVTLDAVGSCQYVQKLHGPGGCVFYQGCPDQRESRDALARTGIVDDPKERIMGLEEQPTQVLCHFCGKRWGRFREVAEGERWVPVCGRLWCQLQLFLARVRHVGRGKPPF